MRFAINKIPRKVTIDVNANPALTALRELQAKTKSANSEVGKLNSGLKSTGSAGRTAAGGANAAGNSYVNAGVRAKLAALKISYLAWAATYQAKAMAEAAAKRPTTAAVNAALAVQYARSANSIPNYRRGGYTGNYGTDDFAGFVHGKEFVFSAPAVANLGVDNLTKMHNAAKSGSPMPVTSGAMSQMVELSPYDRQLLVDVKNAVGLTIDGNALTRAATAGAVNAGRTGRA